MSASATVPSPAARNQSIEAKRAARLKKVERERVVIDYLNRGVSVAEIAMRLDVTEKRMRAIVREALASYLPGPPEEFVALQISRLNEALLVAYSAMSGQNLKAVDRVVRIVRELDRYHGFFAADRRSLCDGRPGLSEAKAEEPLAHLADRPKTAPQAPEEAQSAPESAMAPNASDEAFASLASPAQAPGAPDAPQVERPKTAPQAPEKAQSAPEDATAPNASDEAFASLADPAEAPGAPDAPHVERPETAPQAPEKAQSARERSTAPNASDEAFASLASPAQAPGAPDAPQVERPETAPQAPEKAQSAPANGKAPGALDESFLSALASGRDPRACGTLSTGPIKILPPIGAGALPPRSCASFMSPGLENPNGFNRPNVRAIHNGAAAC